MFLPPSLFPRASVAVDVLSRSRNGVLNNKGKKLAIGKPEEFLVGSSLLNMN
jgi:hypothetical protein